MGKKCLPPTTTNLLKYIVLYTRCYISHDYTKNLPRRFWKAVPYSLRPNSQKKFLHNPTEFGYKSTPFPLSPWGLRKSTIQVHGRVSCFPSNYTFSSWMKAFKNAAGRILQVYLKAFGWCWNAKRSLLKLCKSLIILVRFTPTIVFTLLLLVFAIIWIFL